MGQLSRRAFLGVGTGAAVGLAACRDDATTAPTTEPPGNDARVVAASTTDSAGELDPSDWASVRDQFALRPDVAHFSAFTLAAHPRPVAEAIARHRDGLDTDTHEYLLEHQRELEGAVPVAAADYLGAAAGEIALTDSTTMGLGLLYGGIVVGRGQRVLTTEHEFYATHEALRLRTERSGGAIDRVRLYEDPAKASIDEIVGRLSKSIVPATRVVAVTWVHSGTGVRLPVAEIAAAVAEHNNGRDSADRALLCVDGAHGLGVEAASVADLGADFLVAGTHKWLFGPRGTGIVWGRSQAWEAVQPTIPTFAAGGFERYFTGAPVSTLTPGAAHTPGGYHSFEHRWALAEAFRFHLDVGRKRIAERTKAQARRLKEGLTDIAGVRLVTPIDEALSSGIVCFELPGGDSFNVLDGLERRKIAASVTPYREVYVRLGPSIVTMPEQVDEAIKAVAELA